MKEILENLNTSNRSAIRNTLSNISEQSVTKQIDTSDVDYRRKQIIEALPKLKEKRLLGSKKGVDKIKYDKGEVLRLYSWINPDWSVWKAYNNKEISESLWITYTYTPKVLTAAKRDVADILRIKLDDLEKILKNLRKSNKADIKQVLEEPQSEVQDYPQNIDSFDPKEPQKKPPEAQNIPKSGIPTDHQKEASIHTKITDIPDIIDLESKIKTALEELRQEIENEDGRGKSNRQRNWCDVLNLYYFGVDPDDWKLYSNDKIANQLWISAGTYVSTILKKTKTRLAEKLWIDTDTLTDILKKLKERNRDDIKNILEQPRENTENLKQ